MLFETLNLRLAILFRDVFLETLVLRPYSTAKWIDIDDSFHV